MLEKILGTALQKSATKVLLLGSGELGKEVAIECQRLGIEVIACDRYENAPAMHVAHRFHVLDMLDAYALKKIILLEQPDYIVPEIEAIATDALLELEIQGFKVVPCAKATSLTMNREGIRVLVAQDLKLKTSAYFFADSLEDIQKEIAHIGMPCVIKPVMSSSGKGQSIVRHLDDIQEAWNAAQADGRTGGRTGCERVIVESFIKFDYEITLLTVNAVDGIYFCEPIGHRQENGDYRESWQPQKMSELAYKNAQDVARKVVSALGGYGIFGVELFVKGYDIYFNEVSPRPHDTGFVTLASQDLSEFALHVRAFLGLPITQITQIAPAASVAILGNGTSHNLRFEGLSEALAHPKAQLRLFGKPQIKGSRRLGVSIVHADSVENALKQALQVAAAIKVIYA
ncbi:phosphoribosylglycinamide formyltransferase 2 [Gammaproteobacteria bacterium]|nr:phosphoribosylglycinamide formyltransferase 2 [Gammaproteobacteria bacterium]